MVFTMENPWNMCLCRADFPSNPSYTPEPKGAPLHRVSCWMILTQHLGIANNRINVHLYKCISYIICVHNVYVCMYVCMYVCRYVMVWYGMVWYGMVLVWYGMVW